MRSAERGSAAKASKRASRTPVDGNRFTARWTAVRSASMTMTLCDTVASRWANNPSPQRGSTSRARGLASAALRAPRHQRHIGACAMQPASQHHLQCVTGARLDRRDDPEMGRALADPGGQCRHGFDPSSVRPVRRFIALHRGRFTSAPRWGKRHEKPHCGPAHTFRCVSALSHIARASELEQVGRQPAHRWRFGPIVGAEVRVGPAIYE